MFNKTFLKQLTILYVEDEKIAREQLAKTLKRVFGEVLLAANGLEGFEIYQACIQKNIHIDLILSDINMPKMNGIEMLEKIRENDSETPFIFTTARSETEYLLRAIELNVNHYALKPIDTDDILMRIQTVCEKKYLKKKLDTKQNELKHYLEAVNNVATVFKLNQEGIVTFANESFLEVSQYSQEEITTTLLENILHPEMPPNFLAALFKLLEKGETFKGNIKFLSKQEELFYLNSSIFSLEANDENEYIVIGFINTKEQLEKRNFHKKVMLNMKESKQKENSSKKMVNEQSYKLLQLREYINELDKKLEAEKKKNLTFQKQLLYYEAKLEEINDEKKEFFQTSNQRLTDFNQSYQNMKKENAQFMLRKAKLEEQVEASREEMEKLYSQLDEKEKRLLQLQDLIQYRESQIMLIDPKLLNK